MEEDKRGLELGQKDKEERCREKKKTGWRVKLKKVGRRSGGRGPKCKE